MAYSDEKIMAERIKYERARSQREIEERLEESTGTSQFAFGMSLGLCGLLVGGALMTAGHSYDKVTFKQTKVETAETKNYFRENVCPPKKDLITGLTPELEKLIGNALSYRKTTWAAPESVRYDFTFYTKGKVNKAYECTLFGVNK